MKPLTMDTEFGSMPVIARPKLAVGQAGDWRDELILSKGRRGEQGEPKPILANAMTALCAAPEWRGVLAFNEFSLRTDRKSVV